MAITNSENTVKIPIIGQKKIDKNNQVVEENGSVKIPIAPIIGGVSYIQKSRRGAPYEERQAFDYEHPTDITKSNLIKNPSLSSIEGNYGSYEDALGEIQPHSHKIAHTFLTRLPLTAATKLLEGIGYIGGAAGWAATGDIETMTENPFSVLFKDAEKYIKETAPIYKPKSVQEGTLIDNLGSASFWLDDAADAVAFMAGFAALSYATGGLGGYLTTLGVGSKTAQLTNLALTSTLQAVAEGGTEAAHFKESFEYEAQEIMKQYASELERTGLSPEEIQRSLALKRKELDVARAEAQAGIFRTNLGILIGPNMIMNKFLFGKFFNKSPQVLNRMKAPGSGEILKAPRKLAKKEIGLRYAKNIGGGIASEGFWEEGLQETANEYFKQVGTDETDDGFVEGMWNTYWGSWKNVDFQKAVFLGGFLGTLGGAKGSYSGIKSENKQVNELREVLSRNPNTVLAKTFEGIKPTEEWTKHALDVYQKLNSLKTIHKRDSLKEVFDLMGEEDLSGLVSSHGLLDWAYSLLNIEGGNEILKNQIDSLTEIAYKEYAEKGGTESRQSFEQYKLNIKNQLDSMQEIVDEINKNSGNIFAKIQNNRNIDSQQFEKYKNQVTTDITFAQVLTLNNLKYLESLKKEKIQKIEQKNLENADKDPNQINQADKDTVKRLSTEIENINELYTTILEDYNTLSNKETIRNYFSDYVDNKEDIQAKIEEFAANPREVNNKLEVPDNLSSIAEQAISKEEFTNAEGIKEEIETKKDLVLNIQDNNNNFRKLRVQFEGISSKKDSIKIRFYNEDGTPSKRVANLKADGTVLGDASIQKWGFDSIITKEENNARELFLGKFRETYESLVGEINSKQERLSNNTKAISNTLESIQDNIKEIESLNEDYNSENISEIEVNDANRSILEKFINKKLDNEVKLALNIKELKNLRDSLIELNDVYLSDLEKIEDFIAGIPTDFKELHPVKFDQMIKHLVVQAEGIRQNTENSNNTIVELENLIKEYTEILSQLDNKIESIERQLDRFNVQDINDFNSLLPKELSKLRIRLGRELNIRRLINSRNQFADNLNSIIEQLQPLKARADLLNTELEVIENTATSVAALSMLWQNLYGNLGKPKTPYTVIKSKNENVEDTLGEDNLPKKFAPPMKPFEGTVHAFLYTTTNEENLIKALKENDLEKADAAEPQLLFQRFIDTITEDNIEDITLQLFNRDNLLNKFENILSEAQKEYINQDFMATGVFVIPVYKNGKPRVSSSVLRKGEKSLMFSVLNENIGEIQVEGNEVYLERTGGTRFVDASSRVKDYIAQGWAEAEAVEAVKKELEEAIEDFKTSVRQPVLEGKIPKYGIADINPGKYIPTSTPINITEALNKKIGEIELIVANKETEAFGIKTYNTTPGHVYLNYNNRIVPTLRSTLQEQHVERVLDIIKYIATLEKGQKAELDSALKAINDYTYLVFHSKAKKEGVNNFSFFIAEHKEELTQGVQFGEDFISKYELLSDIDSSLTKLRKFLETKFYQVDRDTLNKNEDITFKKVEKGQLIDAETLNYKEWLLDSKNPKLRVFLPSFPSENSIQKLTTPGVVNKSIKLDIESIPATRSIQKKKTEAIKKTKTISITGEQNRKVLADDIDWERTQKYIDTKKSEGETIPSLSIEEVLKYDSEVTKIGELEDKSDIYSITLKKENKKESGYQVVSKPPIVKEKAAQTSEKTKTREEATKEETVPTEADQKLNEVASNLLDLSTKKPSPKTEKKEGNIIPPEKNVFSKKEDAELAALEETQSKQTDIKESVNKLFETNLELANQVYEALGFKQKLPFVKSDNTLDDDFYIKDELIVTKELQNIRITNFNGSINMELSKLKAKLNALPIGSKFNISEYTKPTSTSLEELLSKINLSESNKILLEKIKPLIKDTKIEYVNKFIFSDSGAVYSDKYNTIRINKSEKNISLEELLMHELLHAATFRKISYFETNTKGLSEKELSALNELENIRKALKEASDKYWDNKPRFARSINPLEGYRVDSIHEIISHAFTNKEFRDVISEIPYKTNKSILDKLVELIANIFGVKQDTILNALFANAEVLLENNQITPQQEQQAKQLYSQYLNTGKQDIKGFKEFVSGKNDEIIYSLLQSPVGNVEAINFEIEKEAVESVFTTLDIRAPESKMIWDNNLERGAFAQIIFSTTGKSMVRSSTEAPMGSLWHEAGHEWIRRHITPQERIDLLEETVKEAGNNVYIIEGKEVKFEKLRKQVGAEEFYNIVEEFLMEEFRNYVVSGQNYNFGKASKKQNFFQRMWNSIVEFIEKMTGKRFSSEQGVEIMNTFEKILKGKWTEETIVNRPEGTALKITGLDVENTNILVRHLNTYFFDFIFNKEVLNQINISDINSQLSQIYSILYDQLYEATTEYNNPVLNIMLNTWDELVTEHIKFLRQYNIQLEVPESLAIERKETKDNAQYLQTNLVNVKETMPSEVKLLIAGLRGDIKQIRALNTPVATTVDFGKTLGLLQKRLSGINSLPTMLERVVELSKKHPYLNTLLERIGVNSDGTIKSNTTLRQEELRRKFFIHFHKADNDFITGIIGDEGYGYNISQESMTRKNKVLDMWKSNIKNRAGEKGSAFVLEKGRYKLDPKAKVSLLKREISVKELFTGKKSIMSLAPTGKKKAFMREFLNLFGIELSEDYRKSKLLEETISYLNSEIAAYIKDNTPLYADSIFDRNSIKIIKELNDLAEEISNLDEYFIDNQINTQKGTEYSIQEKTKLHKIFDSLHSQEIPIDMIPFKDGEGNLGTYNSTWFEMSQKGNAPRIVVMKNLGEERGDKIDFDQLKPSDMLAFQINNILEGTISYPRSEGRGMEYAVNFGKDYIKKSISKKQQIDQYKKYLKSEILTSLAYKNTPEAKRFATSKQRNPEALVFFKDIIPELSKFLENTDIYNGVENTAWEETADTIMRLYNSQIEEGINKFIDQSTATIISRLQELKLIVDLSSESGAKVFDPIGFSPAIFSKNNLNIRKETIKVTSEVENKKGKTVKVTSEYEVIDSSQLKQLANIISYYYTTAGIEFTKLVTGDLATYMKGNISSFHKRTTTFTSTISGSLNDPVSIEFLNKYYKRFDGTRHDTNRKTLVVSDVKVQSSLYPLLQEVLKDAAEAYADMNEADGQTWASLDGYRSAALRAGIWNQNYERTWQYEAQLGFQLMRKWEERNNVLGKNRKFTITKYKELFKEHLPTNFRENIQYYKGTPINIESIKEHSLPVLKLQGSGQIINEGLSQFNKMSITKTSVAPLLPSVIKETQLENVWAEKTIEGLDMLSFEGAEKGEKIGNEEGVLPSIYTTDKNGQGVLNSISGILNSGFIPTEVSWSDIGNQLEIDPSGKSKVTASSQQRALTFVDMFENGEIKEEYTDMADSFIEYTKLQNELVNKARKSFLERLGVVENNEGLTLSEVEKLSQAIFSELNRRLVTDNLAEGVQLVLNSSIKLFDSLPNKRQLINLLQGMFRSNTIAIKRSGDMLTQVSSTGFETNRPNIQGSNHLKMYRPIKPGGTEYTLEELNALTVKDIVKIAPAQAEISLPKSWIKFIEVYYPQRSFQEKLDSFNRDILDSNWEYYNNFKKIRIFLANRIPGQHINSIEALEIVKFHSPTAGSMIILPSEIVAKSGSDFDIDKLTSYFNNIKIEEGIITYDEYSSDSEILWTKYRNKVLRKEKAKKLLTEMEVDLESLINYDTFKLRVREVPEGEADLLKIANTSLEAIYDEIIEDLPDLSKEEFLNLPIEQQNTKEAVENRLNEVSMSVILHPKNYTALMAPNDSNIVQEQANKLAAKSEEVQAHELLNLIYNTNIAENQFSALSLLGIIAVNNTSHSKIQTSPIKYNSDILKILFQQFKNSEGETSLGYVQDLEGNKISQTNSALITATVDAGKETFPAIFRLNYRTSTANPYQLLNRVGVGNTAPLGWRYLTEFFTSPIITEYINKRLVEESRVVNASRYVISKQDTIKELIGEPEGGLLMDSVVEFLSAKEPDIPHARAALIQATQSFIEEYGLLSSKDFTNNPIKTLQAFLYYLEISKTLHTVQNIIRPDTGLPKHTNTIRLRKIIKDRLEKLDIFDNESIEALIQNTFIKEFQNTHNSIYEFMSEFDLSRISPAIDAYLWGTEEVPGLIDIYTNPQLGLPESKLEDIVQKLQNAVITSILHTTPRNTGALNSRYKELFQGKNSYAKRLYRLSQKDQFKENVFLKEMQPVINEFITRRGKNSEVDYVKMFSRKIAVFDSNTITDSIRELIDSGNAEAIKIAEESIEMSVLQSGVQINPFAFFEILPTERYYPFIKNIINKYLELENSGDLVGLFGEVLTDQIMSNLRFDSNIVPRFNPFRKGQRPALRSRDKLIVWEDSNSANYPYLSVEIDNLSPTERNKYKEEGRPIPKELFIYKDTGVIEKYGKVYKRISNYGDGSRMFEIQLDGKPSIIESNNVGEVSRPDINTKKEELSEEYTHIPGDNFIEDYEAYKDSMAPSTPEFEPSKDFNKRFFALMEELGVNITKDSRIFTNGDVINSVKMFTFVKEIADFASGNLDASNFSEGTAGFIFNLLPETHILKKKELKNIENTRLYRELYDSQIENVPINQIKSEAIGLIIEEYLFTIESYLGRGYDVRNTWRGLSKWIKENFKLDTVLKKSLLSELENSYKELLDKSEEQSTEIKNKFFGGNTITDSKSILSRIKESGHPTAPLAEFLLNRIIDNYEIELVPVIRNRDISTAEELKSSLDSPDTTYSGLYRASEDKIYISSKFLGRKGVEVTILHEIIHAVSSRTLAKVYSSTIKDFTELYNHAKKYLPNNMYALRTPAEFLVGLFVDSSLIKPLSKVPSLSGIKEYKNLFLEIFDFILNIIGINKTNNLYAQAFSIATNVISEDLQSRSEFNREAAEFNARMEQVPLFTEEGIPIQDHNKSEIKRVDTNLIKEWENIEGDNVSTYRNFKIVKALHKDRLIGLATQFNISENKIAQMQLSNRSTIYSLRIQKPEEVSPAASESFKEALVRNVPMLSGLSKIELNNVIKLIEKGEIEIIC